MLHARALLALFVIGLSTACGGASGDDAGPTADAVVDQATPDGASPDSLDGDADEAAPADIAPPDIGADGDADAWADTAEAADLPLEELPPDVLIPLSVELYVDGAECDQGTPGVGLYRISLAWTTSIAAVSRVEVALNDFADSFEIPIDEAPATDHTFPLELTAFHFPQVPKVSDLILVRVHAQAPAGQLGQSEPISVAVSATVRACLYPYDPECSDNAPVNCRLPPPTCAGGLVLAAFEGCYHCVFVETCTCDDGSALVCDLVPPECGAGLVQAVQGGCFACVDPWTCAPE